MNPRKALCQCRRVLKARHYITLAGVLLSIVILAGTVAFIQYEKKEALEAEAERGRLIASMLELHVSHTLSTIENALSALGYVLDHAAGRAGKGPVAPQLDARNLIEMAAQNTTYLRSISLLDTDGRLLASSNAQVAGRRFSLSALGFGSEIAATLDPGHPQFVRDLHELGLAPAAAESGRAGMYAIPFARSLMLGGEKMVLLAMVNPAALFPDYRAALGTEASYAALFDYQGDVLGVAGRSEFQLGYHYGEMRMFDTLRQDAESGQFRSVPADDGADTYIVNFQATRKFPVVAVVGMSETQVLNQWANGPGKMKWLGILAAAVVLVLTGVLWRVMLYRENIERELKGARDAAEQANAARGAFLSTMSHEIRTPMNAVVGMASLLRETPLDSEQEEFTRIIEESASALTSIIDDILDFSKIDAGKLRIEAVESELPSIVEASLDVLAAKAREKSLLLMSHVAQQLPPLVLADAGRLRQILLNLVGNAIKFTQAGSVCVRVRPMEFQQDICRVRFEVADSGIGIDAEVIPRLFKPFTQADGSVTRKYGGTGLGLSICKRLVQMMGGSIGVESTAGRGSLFWFELPLQVVRQAGPPGRFPGAESASVMVAVANAMQGEILCDYLQARGFAVTLAGTAQQALQMAPAEAARQLVITDARLPDMTPEAFVAGMAARKAGTRFVLLADNDDVRQDLAGLGFHASMLQPVKQSSLLDAVAAALQQSLQPAIAPARKAPAPAGSRSAAHDHPLILLVEDNVLNQKVAIRQLDHLGYAAHIVNNGQEALEAIAGGSYGLVLMDCQMPVMDGFEATRRLRAMEQSGGTHLQIVAMTANAMQGDRERCLEAGMDDYLAKPILREQLGELLSRRLPLESGKSGESPRGEVAAAAGKAAPQAINYHRLQDVFGDDLEVRQQILEVFIADSGAVLKQFKLAIDSSDLGKIAALSHRLAGSCANLGIDELAGLARAAERAGREKDMEQLVRIHQSMTAAFTRVNEIVMNGEKTK